MISFLMKLQELLELSGNLGEEPILQFLRNLFKQLQSKNIIARNKLNTHFDYFASDAFEE